MKEVSFKSVKEGSKIRKVKIESKNGLKVTQRLTGREEGHRMLQVLEIEETIWVF